MKKLLSKVRRNKEPEQPASRITNDTLAEHRERVLAGGRKFKYPVQYQRHRLVINAIIIGVVAVILLIASLWYLLYSAQNTSEFTYRVTKIIPVPVAIIDGEPVRYSDYLMKYRSGEHYLVEKEQIDIKTTDGKNQLNYIKAQALNDAIADAYAHKLAEQLDIQVTNADLEAFLKQQRKSSMVKSLKQPTTLLFWTITDGRQRNTVKLWRVNYCAKKLLTQSMQTLKKSPMPLSLR